ncbi:TPA: transporter [Pyrococcus horikoshii]|nr:transporter [Pyrococcus horikoshii]
MKRKKAQLLWLLFIAFIVNFSVIYGRKMPVGGNGGDTIIHMAMIRGIYLGRNPFLDQHYNVPPNWYPFLYHALIAFLARLTHISIWSLMIWTPLIFALIMVFAWYKLGEELDKDYGGLLFGSLAFLALKSQLFPNPKELIPIFLPLFYLEYYRYFRDRENRHLLYSGLLLGLMMWSHYGAALPVLAGTIAYALIELKRNPKLMIPPFLSLAVFSPFIVNVLLHIHPGSTMIVEGKWLSALSWSSALHRIASPSWTLPIVTIAFLSLRKRNLEFWNFLIVVIISMIGINVTPTIVYDLGGPAVFPSRFGIPLSYTYLILCGFGIDFLIKALKIPRKQILSLTFSFLLIIYGSWSFIACNYHNFSSKYTYKNFEDLAGNYTKGLVKVSEWIRENTERDAYLIGYPYTLEWIAGFTGRPVVAVSYGHGNPFLDMEQRRKDIEEFFTNPEKREEIIKKYNIKYIILDPYTKRSFNVTIDDFGDNFRIVFQWGEFYILEKNIK